MEVPSSGNQAVNSCIRAHLDNATTTGSPSYAHQNEGEESFKCMVRGEQASKNPSVNNAVRQASIPESNDINSITH